MTNRDIVHVSKLDEWFFENLEGISCSDDARAYVAGVLAAFRSAKNDLGNESVSIAYLEAKQQGEFGRYQRVGDWILWTSVIHPKRFDVDRSLYESLVSLSYDACDRILMRKWKLYNELARNFTTISKDTRCKLEGNLVIL